MALTSAQPTGGLLPDDQTLLGRRQSNRHETLMIDQRRYFVATVPAAESARSFAARSAATSRSMRSTSMPTVARPGLYTLSAQRSRVRLRT
jgi:hypothetical protein